METRLEGMVHDLTPHYRRQPVFDFSLGSFCSGGLRGIPLTDLPAGSANTHHRQVTPLRPRLEECEYGELAYSESGDGCLIVGSLGSPQMPRSFLPMKNETHKRQPE